jgi:hypothetical protein
MLRVGVRLRCRLRVRVETERMGAEDESEDGR